MVGEVKADAGAVLASLAIVSETLGTNADAVAPELPALCVAACARLRVVFDKADDGAVCKTLLRLMLDVFCSPPLMATLNADGVRLLVTELLERLVDRRLNDGSFDGAASEGLMKSINQLMLKLLQLAPRRIALGALIDLVAEHAPAPASAELSSLLLKCTQKLARAVEADAATLAPMPLLTKLHALDGALRAAADPAPAAVASALELGKMLSEKLVKLFAADVTKALVQTEPLEPHFHAHLEGLLSQLGLGMPAAKEEERRRRRRRRWRRPRRRGGGADGHSDEADAGEAAADDAAQRRRARRHAAGAEPEGVGDADDGRRDAEGCDAEGGDAQGGGAGADARRVDAGGGRRAAGGARAPRVGAQADARECGDAGAHAGPHAGAHAGPRRRRAAAAADGGARARQLDGGGGAAEPGARRVNVEADRRAALAHPQTQEQARRR